MTDPNLITKREALALGWVSIELAGLPSLPEGPEWVDLWEQALKATAEERDDTFGETHDD